MLGMCHPSPSLEPGPLTQAFLWGLVCAALGRWTKHNISYRCWDRTIKPVHPKGNQPWLFTRRTDAEAPMFWPPDGKSLLIGKDPDVRKDWGQEEKGMTEDEMVRWHHWLNGQEFEQAPGDGEGQGSLACCSHGVTKSQTPLSNWATTNPKFLTNPF